MFLNEDLLVYIYTIILTLWVFFVTAYLTKKIYHYMISRRYPHNVVVYYNRKIIHIAAAGLVAFLVPFIYKDPLIPFVLGLFFGAVTYIPRRMNKLMYWFQVPENTYEVHFTILWGLSIYLMYLFTHNMFMSVIPAVFMSIGDGVTGIVRNLIYKKRTKSWYGNFAMMAVISPIGYAFAGLGGLVAGVVASLIEKLEGVDDNITIPLATVVVLFLWRIFG